MQESIQTIAKEVKRRFLDSKRVLSFEEFLDLISKDPYPYFRNSYHYILDAINHFGSYQKVHRSGEKTRFKIFDQEFMQNPQPLVGQEDLQTKFYQILTAFVRSGKADKLVALYGPNGSAKSSFIRTLFDGLENYSINDEGILFSFSWVFPEDSLGKGKLGIGSRNEERAGEDDSFAKLDQDKIGAIVRSELHENPILLIPKNDRAAFFDKCFAAGKEIDDEKLQKIRRSFLESELSHKNKMIFDALLTEYQGDFSKVMRHVRIERMYLSRTYRRGLVAIEPKFNIDATIRQVTLDKSMANLPPALHSLNLFQVEGDLVDGNRGIVEFTDFLKRPVESFKYLLASTENSRANLGNVVLFLDLIFMATTNDRQLEAFREHPEFYSFKSRLELVRVPYLLRYSDEEKIYEQVAHDVKGPKELMPHTTKALALWAVLTRLKKPMTKNKSVLLSRLLENLSPLEKAKLYDLAEVPDTLNDEERRELRNHIEDLAGEHQNHLYYEGLLGASARELKVVLQMASQNSQFPTLGPNAVFSELRKLVKRVSDFDYLRQEPVPGGYHDFEGFIHTVHSEWLNWVDQEMREVIALTSDNQLSEYLSNYIQHVIPFVKNEKVQNPHTGKSENPNESFMKDFEVILGVKTDAGEYRKNLISKLGAWSVENKENSKESLPYGEIFPQIMDKLQSHFHKKEIYKLQAMGRVVLDSQAFDNIATKNLDDSFSEAEELAKRALVGMKEKFGYGHEGAKEALGELIRTRYR